MVSDPLGLVGQLIDGQYRLESQVGEGGFSVVYRARHLGLDEPVAVKCLKLQAGIDADSREIFARRFRDEGRLLFRLGQGNLDIVRCMTSATTTSPTTRAMVPYLVLEWLEGQPLAADLHDRRQRGLRGRSLDDVLRLLEPAALALDYAHGQGVVHRDVKPANLFLATSRAGVPRIKVLDFGIAKVLDETIGITMAATRGNLMVCSPRYAAPEQFNPEVGAVGPWTDVFSLALVVLEALRDERVRKADGMAACMTEACDRAVKMTARDLGIQVPAGVEQVLARAVSMDVAARPRTAGELWTELTRAAHESVAAPPPPPSGSGDRSSAVTEPPPVVAPPVLASPAPPSVPSVPSMSSGIPSSARSSKPSRVPVVPLIVVLLLAVTAAGLLGMRVLRARQAHHPAASPAASPHTP